MKRSISWKVFAWILFFIVLVLGVLVGLAKIPIFQYFGSAISQMTGSESNSLEGLKGAPMPDASKNTEIQNKVNSCMERRCTLPAEAPPARRCLVVLYLAHVT